MTGRGISAAVGSWRVRATLVLFLLGGCAAPPPATPLGGELRILGPDAPFALAIGRGTVPEGWQAAGTVPPQALAIDETAGTVGLRITAGKTGFALLRPTHASLLATPFLSWAWHAQPPRQGILPVQIYVGFHDRGLPSRKAWWQVGGDETPVDRIVTIAWDDSALTRGTVIGPSRTDGQPARARYIARGGSEQANRWWLDTVDLSQIYRQVWPDGDPAEVEITVIGIAALPSADPVGLRIAAISLAR